MNEQLKSRLKGFLWHGGMMTLAFVVDYALKNLSSLELGELPTVVLGLIFGQISKYLNSSK
jgi:hypothetical protein